MTNLKMFLMLLFSPLLLFLIFNGWFFYQIFENINTIKSLLKEDYNFLFAFLFVSSILIAIPTFVYYFNLIFKYKLVFTGFFGSISFLIMVTILFCVKTIFVVGYHFNNSSIQIILIINLLHAFTFLYYYCEFPDFSKDLPSMFKISLIRDKNNIGFLLFKNPKVIFYKEGVIVENTYVKNAQISMFEDIFSKKIYAFSKEEIDLLLIHEFS